MNFFKLGILLSVLLFNLSCSSLPKKKSGCYSENQQGKTEQFDFDANVTESSFIDLEPIESESLEIPKTSQLTSYLDHLEQQEEKSVDIIEQLPKGLTKDQHSIIPTEMTKNRDSILHKESLNATGFKLRKEGDK